MGFPTSSPALLIWYVSEYPATAALIWSVFRMCALASHLTLIPRPSGSHQLAEAAVKKEKQNEHESLEKRYLALLSPSPHMMTLLSGCRAQTAAPPAESPPLPVRLCCQHMGRLSFGHCQHLKASPPPLETSAGDLSIDWANNEFM